MLREVRYHEKGGTDTIEPVTIAKQFHTDFAAQPRFFQAFEHASIAQSPGHRGYVAPMLAVTNVHLT